MSTTKTTMSHNKPAMNQPHTTSPEPSLPQTPNWVSKLPTLLRTIGAAAVLFSLYSFLFKGWEGSNDVIRYLILLGHTGLLGAVALISGHLFKEGKSPRLLMMLALVSVPVNFAILGSFIYFGYNIVNVEFYPSFVAWSIANLQTALLLSAGAMIILVPTIVLAFKTLVRGISTPMTVMYIIGNAMLLLPIRTPDVIFLITLTLSILTFFLNVKTSRQRTETKTLEGTISLLLQFLPATILLGRSIWLYSPDAILVSSLAIMTFMLFRHCSLFLGKRSYIRVVLEMLSSSLAVASGLGIFTALDSLMLPHFLAIIIGTMITAAMLYELAERCILLRPLYRAASSLSIIIGMLFNFLALEPQFAALLNIISGVSCIVLSHSIQRRSLFYVGVLLTFIGAIYSLIFAFNSFNFSYWIGLASIGIMSIVAASMIESKGRKIKETLYRYKQNYSGWAF